MTTMQTTEREAFLVRTKAAQSGCLEWIGPRHPNGYGRFTFKAKQRLAHRASFELFIGPLSPDVCVLHKCDNPCCVNPEHLFGGDRGDNARDMAKKGRQWVQKNPSGRPICPIQLKPRGQKHGMSKLTDAAVLAIREKSSQGTGYKRLAAEFACSESLISQVVKGSIWRHIGGPIRATKTHGAEHD